MTSIQGDTISRFGLKNSENGPEGDCLTFSCKNPAGIYLLKVSNRIPRTRCEICPKLTIKTPERHHWHRFGVFVVNFEHILHLVLLFLLLTLSG